MLRTIVLSATCAGALVIGGCSTAAPSSTETGAAERRAAETRAVEAQEPTECSPVTSTDLNTEDGWLGLIGQAPETVSLVIDDGRGRTVEHRPDEQQPLASAVKVVHLGAYARAVAAGQLDPNEQVPVSEWEKWYVPGADGGAHPLALKRLGIANDGTASTDPAATVRLDDLVTAMVQESDNAAPDYLRHRLGDDALIASAEAGGWEGFDPPSLVTSTLSLFDPALGEGDRWATANRWASDPQFRIDVSAALQVPSYEDQAERVHDLTAGGSAAQLNGMYRAFTDGSFGDGSDIVLRQLEYQEAPDGAEGLGFKGGNWPGVLTQGFELRRDDGTVATAVWLTDSLSADRYDAALTGLVYQQALIIEAMQSSDVLDRIACVV